MNLITEQCIKEHKSSLMTLTFSFLITGQEKAIK